MVDSALRSSRRMSRLVADLLLLARADAGRLGEHRRCDLAEIAGDAAVEVAPMIGEPRAGDRQRPPDLRSRATPTSCTGWSSTCSTTPPATRPPGSRIELRLRSEGDEAVVEVADDGPGHPAEMRDQVFDRFVRGDGPADTAAAPAPASASRSSAPSPPPTAARSRRPSPPSAAPSSASGSLSKTEQAITTPLGRFSARPRFRQRTRHTGPAGALPQYRPGGSLSCV